MPTSVLTLLYPVAFINLEPVLDAQWSIVQPEWRTLPSLGIYEAAADNWTHYSQAYHSESCPMAVVLKELSMA